MPRGRKASPKPPPVGEVAGGSVPMPEGMGAAAVAKWKHLVPLIAQQVQLKELDADALRQYCEAAVIRQKAVEELEGKPLLLMGPNGAQYTNPLMKVMAQQEALMGKMAERFGLDPASRRRLHLEAQKKGSALTELLSRGRNRPKPALA